MRSSVPSIRALLLVAIVLQAIGAAAPAGCAGMSATPGNRDHSVPTVGSGDASSVHEHSTYEAAVDPVSCECDPSAPTESDKHRFGSCQMATHCVSSPAVTAQAAPVCDPTVEDGMPSDLGWQPRTVTLPHPTPPPRA